MSLDIYLRNPVKCPHCGGIIGGDEVYSANITHNVIPMWQKAGVYDALYESDGHKASEFVEVLNAGMKDMEANFSEYEKLDSPNGWGLAKNALPFLRDTAEAFRRNPDATIRVSR